MLVPQSMRTITYKQIYVMISNTVSIVILYVHDDQESCLFSYQDELDHQTKS